jgi:hypothetical protein
MVLTVITPSMAVPAIDVTPLATFLCKSSVFFERLAAISNPLEKPFPAVLTPACHPAFPASLIPVPTACPASPTPLKAALPPLEIPSPALPAKSPTPLPALPAKSPTPLPAVFPASKAPCPTSDTPFPTADPPSVTPCPIADPVSFTPLPRELAPSESELAVFESREVMVVTSQNGLESSKKLSI